MGNTKKSKPTFTDYKKRDEYIKILNEEHVDSDRNLEFLDFMNAFDWSAEIFMMDEKCGLNNALGEMVLPPVFEDMKLRSNTDVSRGDWIVARQNGKWGVVLADVVGTWLIQPEYDFIGYPNNLTHVCKDGKWGVLDLSKGEYLIPLVCDMVHDDHGFMFINGIGTYEKDGKTGVIGHDGNFTEPIFEEVENEFEVPVKVKYNGQWGFINEDNKFTMDEDEACYFYEM